MNHPIKIAGVGCSWSKEYTKQYAQKLEDMGFHIRLISQIIDGKESFFVGYSYREFTVAELDKALNEKK